MAISVYRVVVRGQFRDLTTEQREALLAEVDDHSIFQSSFTEWGTFTYESNLVNFQLRYEVRVDTDEEPDADPVAIGIAKADAQMAEWGLPTKHVRATAADMSAMWRAPEG